MRMGNFMLSKIAARVANLSAHRFQVKGGPSFAELADASQEAEFLHAEDGIPHEVVALLDEPPSFAKGEVVYVSKGAPE